MGARKAGRFFRGVEFCIEGPSRGGGLAFGEFYARGLTTTRPDFVGLVSMMDI